MTWGRYECHPIGMKDVASPCQAKTPQPKGTKEEPSSLCARQLVGAIRDDQGVRPSPATRTERKEPP